MVAAHSGLEGVSGEDARRHRRAVGAASARCLCTTNKPHHEAEKPHFARSRPARLRGLSLGFGHGGGVAKGSRPFLLRIAHGGFPRGAPRRKGQYFNHAALMARLPSREGQRRLGRPSRRLQRLPRARRRQERRREEVRAAQSGRHAPRGAAPLRPPPAATPPRPRPWRRP